MSELKLSNKKLLDALVDAVQDLDNYYGRTGRNDWHFKTLEKEYKRSRSAVLQRMQLMQATQPKKIK